METLKHGTELYNHLMDTFDANFEQNCSPSFGNLIWQLVVNDAWEDRKPHCFVPVLCTHDRVGYEIGIAEQGETGYYPTHVHFLPEITFDKASDLLEEINQELFGLMPRATSEIILRSMRT